MCGRCTRSGHEADPHCPAQRASRARVFSVCAGHRLGRAPAGIEPATPSLPCIPGPPSCRPASSQVVAHRKWRSYVCLSSGREQAIKPERSPEPPPGSCAAPRIVHSRRSGLNGHAVRHSGGPVPSCMDELAAFRPTAAPCLLASAALSRSMRSRSDSAAPVLQGIVAGGALGCFGRAGTSSGCPTTEQRAPG
jgi:hypothetical protein